jgi:hypothetical protein
MEKYYEHSLALDCDGVTTIELESNLMHFFDFDQSAGILEQRPRTSRRVEGPLYRMAKLTMF